MNDKLEDALKGSDATYSKACKDPALKKERKKNTRRNQIKGEVLGWGV